MALRYQDELLDLNSQFEHAKMARRLQYSSSSVGSGEWSFDYGFV